MKARIVCFGLLLAFSSNAMLFDKHEICKQHKEDTSSTEHDASSEDRYDELSELDHKKQHRINRKKKIIYRRRTYAIKQQETLGVRTKHTPHIIAFKRIKNLKKMFSE